MDNNINETQDNALNQAEVPVAENTDISQQADIFGNNEIITEESTGEKKTIRSKNSKLPVREEQKKSPLSAILLLLLIVTLIALFAIGMKMIKTEQVKEAETKTSLIPEVTVKDVNINIPDNATYKVDESGNIYINDISFTPQYNEDGDIISYVDEEGNEYKVYEKMDMQGLKTKYIDIDIEIPTVHIDFPTVEQPTVEVELPTIDKDINVEIPSVEFPSVEIPSISIPKYN